MARNSRRPQAQKPRSPRNSDRMRMGAEPRGERYTRNVKYRARQFEG